MSTSPRSRPIKRPITSRGQLTRQKLLAAAETVFGEKGYKGASVVEITQRAGVAQGTFYVYFPDKKAIFIELVRELNHNMRREIVEAVAGLSDRIEVERVGFRTFFRYAQEHRHLYKIVRLAESVDEDVFRWHYRRLAEGYTRGLAQAMDAGQVRRLDPESLAYCLMGISEFLGMRWVLWEGESPPDHVFESIMSFIRFGMDLHQPSG